ncbi:MAG: site-specific integrase [Bifidobacteriaceae bacterium]|jgi:integrase|nr:site-specific integrase [Bifidobacteriaceae bacterium]
MEDATHLPGNQVHPSAQDDYREDLMAHAWVEDQWVSKEGDKLARHGIGSRWHVRWREPTEDGTRFRDRAFAKKTDAEEFATKIDNDLRASVYRDPDLGKAPFREIAEQWLAAHLSVRDSTAARYERELRMYTLPKFGHRPINTITRAEVAAWVADLHHGRAPARYKIRGTKPPEFLPVQQMRNRLGASSIEHIVTNLGAIMKWALVEGRIDRNPVVGLSLPKAESEEHVYLTHQQVRDLADAAERVTGVHQDAVLIYALAYTGMRINEALAAKTGALDLVGRKLRVVKTWTVDKDGARVLGPPKSHERRTVPLTAFLAKELAALVKDSGPGDFIFQAKRGGPIHDHNWRPRVWDKAVKEAGLDGLGLTPHKMRHTAASAAIAAGADVKVVQQMLGHASAAMTLDVYGHLWPSRLGEVADAMEEARRNALAPLPPAPVPRPAAPIMGM